MKTATLVLVGGLLGAGKTRLLSAAAERLEREGKRVALITNDQSEGLVDTAWLHSRRLSAAEVSGGCFCCRLDSLVDAIDQLLALEPDVILAEPVGSCTDLVATVALPLRQRNDPRLRIAPLTVLVDPAQARELIGAGEDDPVAYLFRNQIAEADLVCFSKADLTREQPHVSDAPMRRLSSATGEGVTAWLHEVLHGDLPVGEHILEIDYQRYAEAEVALGWVHVRAELAAEPPLSPSMVAGPVMDAIAERLDQAGIAVVHAKLLDQSESGALKVSLVSGGSEPIVEGDMLAEPSTHHQLLLNIRALGDPEAIRDILLLSLSERFPTAAVTHSAAFRPSPPKPTMRVTRNGA